jgi:hypothetical protein
MKKKKARKPRRKRWIVTCEATVRVLREFHVLAYSKEEAIDMCVNRGGNVNPDIDAPEIQELETESETNWKAESRSWS